MVDFNKLRNRKNVDSMIKNLVIDTIIQVNEHPDTPNEDIIHQIEKTTDEIINSINELTPNTDNMEHICKTCKHWDDINQNCDSDAFVYTGQGEDMPENGLGYSDFESYNATVTTGPLFGCIHWRG